ncbi:hypothetical protein JHK85_010937 [Glycine max]|nr:hypothetical protein JHK85_010937 [Glycine max]
MKISVRIIHASSYYRNVPVSRKVEEACFDTTQCVVATQDSRFNPSKSILCFRNFENLTNIHSAHFSKQ